MEHVSSSRNNECIFTDPNMENGHEKDHPLFSNFPSPFFDDISTIPILTNNLISPNKPLNIEPLFSDQSKRFEKRSVGKKDRHSKIHTAQGPRDRRMRLSLQIARQFFDLQDLLGFDKASNTIEWLFCKSNKAIQEVAGSFNPQQTNQNMSDQEMKPMDNSKEAEEIKNKESRRKNLKNNYSVKETRDQARARARERTRERLMIQLELEKSKQLFGENPKDEIYKLGLGLEDLGRPNIHNIKELGFTSCQSEPIQQELRTYHDLGESTECSTLINHNPSAGWINSCNEFSGMPEEWDADSLLTDYDNYGIFSSTSHLTGDIYEQNPNLFFMSTTNNILQFQSQNQGM